MDDGFSNNTYNISVSVTNTAPVFQSALIDQSVTVGGTLNYNWPTTFDAEGHSLVISVSSNPSTPDFMSSLSTLSFTPTVLSSGVAIHLIVNLGDFFSQTTYTMTVTVIPNTPPTFVSVPIAQTVYPG